MNHPHTTLPSILTGYPLDVDMGLLIPEATTNVVTNPSFETNTTNWTASGGAAIARVATQQYAGAWSLRVTPAGAADGVYYGLITATASQSYTASVYLKGPGGTKYNIVITDNGAGPTTIATGPNVQATGKWQRLTFSWYDSAGGTRRIYVRFVSGSLSPFYIDAAQVEAKGHATTYCDGDQPGLIDNPASPAYLWDGTPHASTSRRSAMSRAGGAFKTFAELGLAVSAIVGLGLPPPNNASIPYGLLDGSLYQRSTTPARQFSIIGRIDGYTPLDTDRKRAALEDAVRYDAVTPAQPVTLVYHTSAGDERRLEAVYQSGLERKADNLYAEQVPVTFTAYMPFVSSPGSTGYSLTASQTVAAYIHRRSPAGVWSEPGGGVDDTVRALCLGQDGKIYAGGDFHNAGGAGAAHIAAYDPIADTWAALGAGVDGAVFALACGPDGKIYAGGDFVNAGGAAANRIAVWNPAAGTWATIGAGAGGGFDGRVYAIAFTRDGTLYAGGAFATANAVAMNHIAYLSAGAWTAIGTGLAGGVTAAQALVADPLVSDRMYLGGIFTTADGVTVNNVASTDGTTFTALSAGWGGTLVRALAALPNGLLYAEGTWIAGNHIQVWNGSSWAGVGGGLSSDPTTYSSLTVGPDGRLWQLGAAPSDIQPFGSIVAWWSGSQWYPADIVPDSPDENGILATPDGSLYTCKASSVQAAVTVVNNPGQATAYPVITISNATNVYEVINNTTGKALYFRGLVLAAGETMTIDLTPGHKTIISNWRGNLAGYLLPGSDLTTWGLATGNNNVGILAPGATVDLHFLPLFRSISR